MPHSGAVLAISEIHSYWICPVWWGAGSDPREIRRVERLCGRGSGFGADVTL